MNNPVEPVKSKRDYHPQDLSTSLLITRACPLNAHWIAKAQVAMALETENLTLDFEKVHRGVLSLIQTPDLGFYYVGTFDGEVVACGLILKEWSDWRAQFVWWLHSVYVVPAKRNLGVFTKLYNEIVKDAKEANAAGIRLYVDKTNAKAQSIYKKLGLKADHYDLFESMF